MLREEIKKQTLGYIAGALGLVTALAWNEAIKGSIEYLFPLSQNSLPAKFIYALLMTAIVVIFANYIMKIGSTGENK